METQEPIVPSQEVVPEKKGFEFAPLTTPRAIVLNGFIIAAAIIIGAGIVVHGPFTGSPKEDGASAAQAAKPDIRAVDLSGEPFIGNPSAKAVVAYWSDFQCPYCKKFETTTFPQLIAQYVDTGKVAVVFKDFAFLGADSNTAGLYARAVWDLYPKSYFAWRTAMFVAQDGENAGFGDEASIQDITKTIANIDVAKVAAQVKANKDAYQKKMDADRDEAVHFGIQGTPSFITGTTLIPGYSPIEAFQKALDPQVK